MCPHSLGPGVAGVASSTAWTHQEWLAWLPVGMRSRSYSLQRRQCTLAPPHPRPTSLAHRTGRQSARCPRWQRRQRRRRRRAEWRRRRRGWRRTDKCVAWWLRRCSRVFVAAALAAALAARVSLAASTSCDDRRIVDGYASRTFPCGPVVAVNRCGRAAAGQRQAGRRRTRRQRHILSSVRTAPSTAAAATGAVRAMR